MNTCASICGLCVCSLELAHRGMHVCACGAEWVHGPDLPPRAEQLRRVPPDNHYEHPRAVGHERRLVVKVICTDAERDLIVGGATHLVVPGDLCGRCRHRTAPKGMVVACDNLQPPQRWVDATGPCEHTNTTTPVYNGGNYGNYGTRRCKDCGATRDDWSDWTGGDGRKRVALAVIGDDVRSRALHNMDRLGIPQGMTGQEHPVEAGAGSVVFAHATVEVLPVCWHDDPFPGDPCIVVYRDRCDQYVVLYRNDTIEQIWLDPLPVPGRDFVALLDNVRRNP